MGTAIDDSIKQKLLDSLAEESSMVISTAYAYAKNYVLYGEDITKKWTTAAQQASIIEKVSLNAWAQAHETFRKEYETRLKADIVAMLKKIQLEIEENSYPEEVYGDEYGINKVISTNDIYQIIQQKINTLKSESEEE